MLTECTRSDICLEGRGSDIPAQGAALGIGSGVENSNALKGQNRSWSRILFRPFRAGRILIRIGSPGPTPQAGFPPPGLSCFGPFGAAEKARLQNLRRGGKGLLAGDVIPSRATETRVSKSSLQLCQH